MGKLPTLSGADVCAILERAGFVRVRQRGSHVIMQKKLAQNSTITVPVPDHSALAKGTLQSIIRQSGLNRDAFVQ